MLNRRDTAIAKVAAKRFASAHEHLCSRAGVFRGQTADEYLESRGVRCPGGDSPEAYRERARWFRIMDEAGRLGKELRGADYPMRIAR